MNQEHPPKKGAIGWLAAVDRYLDTILKGIIGFIMLVLAIMVFAIVIMRYGFSYSIFGMHELLKCTLIELAEALRTRRASPVELIEVVLARVDEANPDLNFHVKLSRRTCS